MIQLGVGRVWRGAGLMALSLGEIMVVERHELFLTWGVNGIHPTKRIIRMEMPGRPLNENLRRFLCTNSFIRRAGVGKAA